MKNFYSSIENLKIVGDRVAMVKGHFELNITKFAKQLEISHSFLSQIISGKRKPSYEFLCALSVKFNIDLHWLFSGDGEMIDGQRMGNDIYSLVQKLVDDPEVVELLLDLQVPAMKHFLLAQHQLLSGSPEFKNQKKRFQPAAEAK
ncbi:MAG: helix-turn-helix transcriptional regulator [Candidatus Aminicenantes bacterium]|nr:helix-turn-helix transcriptional regulator [Candidatus Aminicenantes bacterium]